jgi:hypothetical protein
MMLLDLLGQQSGVSVGVERQEGFAEACREGCLWLFNALLCSGDLCSVTRQEVIHGLLLGELTNGR